jgi:hypothetical protein
LSNAMIYLHVSQYSTISHSPTPNEKPSYTTHRVQRVVNL